MALFDVRELVDMAIKDEETGAAFYNALAEATQSDKVKERCAAIAQQEVGHAKRFRAMLDELGGSTPREQYPGEYEAYVAELLQERAFTTPALAADKARSAGSDAEAIEIAMRMEKDTLLFLQEIKKFVAQKNHPHVDEVIDEERDHLMDLGNLKRSLA